MSQGDRGVGMEGGTELWRFEAGDSILAPTVSSETVYFASHDAHVYAVDAASGQQKWAFESDGPIDQPPVVTENTVYAGSRDEHLYAVSVESGEERWRAELGAPVVTSSVVADDTVYVGGRDNRVYAVTAESGKTVWCFDLDTAIRRVATVGDETLYIEGRDGVLYAIDAETGEEAWRFEAGGTITSQISADAETIYIGSDDSRLYAVDAADGEEQWRFDTGDGIHYAPTVGDDTVYVGSYDDHLYAIADDSGRERWSFKRDGRGHGSPIVNDGAIYVTGKEGYLYAVDATSGSEQWRFEGEQSIEGLTLANGTVYADGRRGRIYAVDAGSGTERWRAEIGGDRIVTTVVANTILYALAKDRRGPQAVQILHAVATEANSQSGSGTTTQETKPSLSESVIDASDSHIPAPEAVASPPRRGDLSIDDLTIVDEIGVGGQAVIRKARVDEGTPSVVALREPDTSTTLTREAVEDFTSRADTWATIDAREREKPRWDEYEHIVGVIALGERQPWLAMEYMDEGDLKALLAEYPDGLPVAQALWYGECVCKGLEIAHNLGRVHLDVKPENVLLKETDGWPWPKLADWGLARTLADETGTMDGLSVQYASPEQFDSDEFGDPDQLTDIYQTGALVYTLLTGAPPATGSQFEVMQQVMSEGSITPPSEHRPDLPAAVDAALEIALERRKTDRYSSISMFGDALRMIRTGERPATWKQHR